MDQPESVGTVASLVQFICDDWDAETLHLGTCLAGINSGYREFQRRCSMRGLPFMRNNAVLSLPANTTVIGADTSPAVPDDFVLPLQLWEKQAGQIFRDPPMEERTDLPDRIPGTFNRFWQFEAGQINLIGATSPLLVKMSYQRFLPILTDENQALPIPFVTDPIAYFTAYAVGLARGVSQEFRAEVSGKGDALLDELTSIYTHRAQLQPRRRPPNHDSRRF